MFGSPLPQNQKRLFFRRFGRFFRWLLSRLRLVCLLGLLRFLFLLGVFLGFGGVFLYIVLFIRANCVGFFAASATLRRFLFYFLFGAVRTSLGTPSAGSRIARSDGHARQKSGNAHAGEDFLHLLAVHSVLLSRKWVLPMAVFSIGNETTIDKVYNVFRAK
jgi:hypothetical protein